MREYSSCDFVSFTIDRVILAFERLTPLQVCRKFSRGVGRPVKYIHGPIKIQVNIPSGYREHLEVLEDVLGNRRAPYFGPTYEYPNEALSLWEGYRGIEEYAREVFPLEEAANGLTWMDDSMDLGGNGAVGNDDAEDNDDDDQDNDNDDIPFTNKMPYTTPAMRTLRNHPESESADFFVGSC